MLILPAFMVDTVLCLFLMCTSISAEVSVLEKIASRASMMLESMTIPEMVEYFVLSCGKEHSAIKFLDRKAKETYLKYMIENTDIAVRLMLCILDAYVFRVTCY